jgi:uncharacterized membrane protein YtjA (UPF0391 family)
MFQWHKIFLLNAFVAAVFTFSTLPPLAASIAKGLLLLFLTFYVAAFLEIVFVRVRE